MSTMLMLNFAAFTSKKNQKSYFKFDMYDIERKELHQIFTEQGFCPIPDGVVPTDKECRDTFPRIADVDFTFRQYNDNEGRVRYAPNVQAINSWTFVDLTKLKK